MFFRQFALLLQQVETKVRLPERSGGRGAAEGMEIAVKNLQQSQ